MPVICKLRVFAIIALVKRVPCGIRLPADKPPMCSVILGRLVNLFMPHFFSYQMAIIIPSLLKPIVRIK